MRALINQQFSQHVFDGESPYSTWSLTESKRLSTGHDEVRVRVGSRERMNCNALSQQEQGVDAAWAALQERGGAAHA